MMTVGKRGRCANFDVRVLSGFHDVWNAFQAFCLILFNGHLEGTFWSQEDDMQTFLELLSEVASMGSSQSSDAESEPKVDSTSVCWTVRYGGAERC